MIDPSLPVQKAIFAALDAEFTNDEVGIYDRVPKDAAGKITARFPYIHIGEDHVQSDADQCHDASSVFPTVHVWSRAVGKVEAKTIMARVVRVLDAVLPIEGFGQISALVETGPLHMGAPDGLTSHSVVTFHYRMAPTA